MTAYFHGGPDGLHVGQYIRPADETGAKTYGKQIAAARGLAAGTVRTDCVYLTTMVEAALMFASAYPRPMIYEVTPVGDLTDDPDYHGSKGQSVSCERALILRRIPPRPSDVQAARAAMLGDFTP